jgi:predicted nucleic acid-binding protein
VTGELPYLLDTLTARTLLQADAPTELRHRIRAARYGSVWISAITEGQLHAWVDQRPHRQTLGEALGLLLRNIPTAPFDRSAALAYANLCREAGRTSGVKDTEWMVAGHALSMEATLITADQSLRQIDRLRSENWLVA